MLELDCWHAHTLVHRLADTFRDYSTRIITLIINTVNVDLIAQQCDSDSNTVYRLKPGAVELSIRGHESLVVGSKVNSKRAACQKLEGCVSVISVIQTGGENRLWFPPTWELQLFSAVLWPSWSTLPPCGGRGRCTRSRANESIWFANLSLRLRWSEPTCRPSETLLRPPFPDPGRNPTPTPTSWARHSLISLFFFKGTTWLSAVPPCTAPPTQPQQPHDGTPWPGKMQTLSLTHPSLFHSLQPPLAPTQLLFISPPALTHSLLLLPPSPTPPLALVVRVSS